VARGSAWAAFLWSIPFAVAVTADLHELEVRNLIDAIGVFQAGHHGGEVGINDVGGGSGGDDLVLGRVVGWAEFFEMFAEQLEDFGDWFDWLIHFSGFVCGAVAAGV
jgi:hypothetical protein